MTELPPEQKAELGKDLQSFIRFLEKHYPNEILRVKQEVDPIFEAMAILWRLENERRYPLVVFDNVKGAELPAVTNVHASFPRLAMAIGLPIDATPRDFILASNGAGTSRSATRS
jgi:UbiD family decarboxylase